MSSSAIGGDALGRAGNEESPFVSPSIEGVLSILGVDGSMGEAIPIDVALSIREADDLFRADVVRWAALDVPSIMVEEDLKKLREAYRIPADIELMLPGPNELACFPRRGCTSLHLNVFVSGMRLPLHHMFRRILRAYGLAPTQRVVDDPEPDLDVPSFYGIANTLPRCELSRDVVDIVRSIYQAAPLTQSYGLILNRHHCLVELSLMASKAEIYQGRRPRPTLACLMKQRPKVLVPSYAEDTLQRKVIEDLSREENRAERKGGTSGSGPSQPKKKAVELVDNYVVCAPQPLQRTLSVNPSREVALDIPPWVDLVFGGLDVGPFDSRKKLRELIGPSELRISDDTLKNISFFPSMGAQAIKKYFTPKWEEFASHREPEDVLEAGLAATVRATNLQLKVLEEFWTCMHEHKKLVAEASKSDKEHQQALEEALETTNKEKRHLQSESVSCELEVQRLRGDLEVSEKGRKEAEAEVARLLGEKKEMEAKLESVEADFIANFHNTEAYTNFSDYFARVEN
ncbi:putative abhydrolase domain-containing protein [Abeliophyllum distichum]|uniref:Abhydrolase domain-containing protein n=1 Tax=Abeliophyllum distichum TaxID=126358 RepID=A0ABD1PR51_9LAMI